MKITVLFVIFGLLLTWLEPIQSQRDVRIPPMISTNFPAKYDMPTSKGTLPYKCEDFEGTPKPRIYWQYYNKGVFQSKLPTEKHSRMHSYNGTQLYLAYIDSNEQYQCVAENEYGTALSGKIRVIQADAANFDRDVKDKPYEYTQQVGNPLLIPCKYDKLGVPNNLYQWKYQSGQIDIVVKPGKRIYVSENGSLVFSYLEESDGNKLYICNIENKILNTVVYGSWSDLKLSGQPVTSKSTTLMYHTPNNTVALYLKQFRMQCIFGGKPVPSIQWTKSGTSRLSNRFRQSAQNNELFINPVMEEDEGLYTCTGTQPLGNPLSVSFYIDVKGSPVWVKKLTSLIVSEGQKGVFHCDARPVKGEKPLPKPTWYKNGRKLNIAPGGIKDRTHLSSDGKTLTIHDAQKRTDVCNYQCSVANGEGEIFADAAFNVILNTKVLVAPQSQTIEKGDVAMFDVSAETDPLKEKVLSYTWIINGRKIEFVDLFDIYVLKNNSLVINTTGMDENRFQIVLGNYSVNISNEIETVTKYASLMGNPTKKPIVSQSGMDLRWIALIVAVVLLFIIFILLLCVLFNRHGGDDYSVDKKERKAGHDPEKELADGGFHDLPRTDDDPVKQKPDNVSISTAANSMGSDETDSMEEYSDVDAGSRFNEDGSFIGAYEGHESKGNVSNV